MSRVIYEVSPEPSGPIHTYTKACQGQTIFNIFRTHLNFPAALEYEKDTEAVRIQGELDFPYKIALFDEDQELLAYWTFERMH